MSTPQFHTLTVKDIRRETADCVSVAFEIPDHLRTDFQYQAGQYITIKANVPEHGELRRSYSICSAPSDNELRVAIKKVYQGVFSTFVNDALSTKMTLDIMPPMGNFIPSAIAEPRAYYGFASGSGITPILSIIKTVLAANPESTFTLIYGNKNIGSIIFREELEALKNIYISRFRVIHILSRERTEVQLNHGRIDTAKCEQLFDQLLDVTRIDEAFICGPEDMTLGIKQFLLEKGVDASKIKFELFGTNASKKTMHKTSDNAEDKGPKSRVSIKVDGRTFDMELAYEGQSILDAALENGADLPFACKGGVCCTCRAKVVEGNVIMDVNYALDPTEVKQGYVLSCQAHPRSEKVVIDFDVR
jgi:ring-1,2-phenylacetyl-CoA epoxidase subunit PaaE